MISQKFQQLFNTCKRSTYLRRFLQYLWHRRLWRTCFNSTIYPFITVPVLSAAKCLLNAPLLVNFDLFMASTPTNWWVSRLIIQTACAAIIALLRESRMWPLLNFIWAQLSYLLSLVVRECCVIMVHVDTSNEVNLILEVPLVELIVRELLLEKIGDLLLNWFIYHFRSSPEGTVWPWIGGSPR